MDFSEIEAYSFVSLPHVYEDGIVHKNFVYFSPHLDKNNERETYPLRYDTTKPFTDEQSWEHVKLHLTDFWSDSTVFYP